MSVLTGGKTKREGSDTPAASREAHSLAGTGARITPLGQVLRGSILISVVAAVMIYAYVPAREFQRRMDCCENLKAIHAGRATFESLRCPTSGRGYERIDYAEVVIPFPHIVAYEPLDNHGGDGGAILFSDGHAEFLMKGSYLSRLASDHKNVADYLNARAEQGESSGQVLNLP